MNILITSAGIRGYIIEYFKEVFKGKDKVFAADCNKYAPALYNADNFFLIPQVGDNHYKDELLELCLKNQIKGVVSLNDRELPILAGLEDYFKKNGIQIIISNEEVIEICYDKYKTFQFFKKNHLYYPKSFIYIDNALEEINIGSLKFPLLIKPRKGSASQGIDKVFSVEELKKKFIGLNDYMIQEFLSGDEFGVDVFSDSSLRPVSVFMKKKIKMRSGETDKAITVYDKKMINYISKIIKKLGIYGPVDIDLFKRGDEYIVMEINPRFGGGYPLSHAIGANFPKKVYKLLSGETILPELEKEYPNDVVMMKQYEIVIRKFDR